jgi:hypothetical protein
MRARCADGEHLRASTNHQHRLAAGVTKQHHAIVEIGYRNALCEVRTTELALFTTHRPFAPSLVAAAELQATGLLIKERVPIHTRGR